MSKELVLQALQAASTAMNDYLNGKHFNSNTGKNDTYFSQPLELCEKAIASMSTTDGDAESDIDWIDSQLLYTPRGKAAIDRIRTALQSTHTPPVPVDTISNEEEQ